MSLSSFIHPCCRYQLCLYPIQVTGSYFQILRKYPHFLLLFTLENSEIKVQPTKQRNLSEVLGDIL